MKREGHASDQNKIISIFFSLSSSEQSRNVDSDIREGTYCGNVRLNEKESLQTTLQQEKGKAYLPVWGNVYTRSISLTQQGLL